MLKLPVKDSKTSVSDTASALQALVSFQYQNKTANNWRARVHHVQTQTKHKPPARRQGAANAGQQEDQRNSKHCQNYLHELFADSTHCQRGLPDRASDWRSRCVNECSGRSFQSRLWRGASQDLRGCWQVAQTCATPLSLKRYLGVPCSECRYRYIDHLTGGKQLLERCPCPEPPTHSHRRCRRAQ